MRVVFAIVFVSCSIGRAGDPPKDWAYLPVQRPALPDKHHDPIDAFLLNQLAKVGLKFSPPADRAVLLRRVTLDLTGLPPTPEALNAFLTDRSPQAYEAVVDRLLASPQFGERAALWWLDLVRFAETDGFNADGPRSGAWRYRDYVIESFNRNKPYDRFIREQLAGDELYPDDPFAWVATGFLRHYPDEHNAVNLEQRRQEILNDITDTTGAAFLGITLGCAKCHDHKTDPIAQDDYYRMQAFFAGLWPVEYKLQTSEQQARYEEQLRVWETKTAEIRRQLAILEAPYRDKAAMKERSRFDHDYARLVDIPFEQRSPWQKQIAVMVEKQIHNARNKFNPSQLKGEARTQWDALSRQLADHVALKPAEPQTAMAMTDVGPESPPHYLLKRGNWQKRGEEVEPGFIASIDNRNAEPKSRRSTSGRRTELANWIANDKNPLTARVMVNRIWQHVFGRGIVPTSSDFGLTGDLPTHPELLDWLASEFMRSGWNIKAMYRALVLSQAYRQTSRSDAGRAIDPENRLLWRSPRKRLDGETLRDAMLAVAGTINLHSGGPSVFPELPNEMKGKGGWTVSPRVEDRQRRSIYVYVKRNLRYPLFALFDAPDRNETCSRRFVTTTAPQALMLMNDTIILDLAKAFAENVRAEVGDDRARQIEQIYRRAFSRAPSRVELDRVGKFLEQHSGTSQEALVDLCHAILNVNEFLYVD